MEILFGIAVNDASLCATFASEVKAWLDPLAQLSDGQLGLGFYGSGEMLTRKQPIVPRADHMRLVRDLSARQALIWATTTRPASLEQGAPLRYRDWLVAATGTESLGPEFVARTRAELSDFAFADRRKTTPDEALMMVFMDTLHRASLLDAREFTTESLWRAFGTAVTRVRTLAGTNETRLSVLLHRHGQLFALNLGRSLRVRAMNGLDGSARRRSAGHRHFRGVVVSDQWADEGELVASGCEVGADAVPRMVSLTC